jgi:hypothetical protein
LGGAAWRGLEAGRPVCRPARPPGRTLWRCLKPPGCAAGPAAAPPAAAAPPPAPPATRPQTLPAQMPARAYPNSGRRSAHQAPTKACAAPAHARRKACRQAPACTARLSAGTGQAGAWLAMQLVLPGMRTCLAPRAPGGCQQCLARTADPTRSWRRSAARHQRRPPPRPPAPRPAARQLPPGRRPARRRPPGRRTAAAAAALAGPGQQSGWAVGRGPARSAGDPGW